MKKNLTRIISLVLVMLMVLPVSVFAADPKIEVGAKYVGTTHDVMYEGAYVSIYDGGEKNSIQLTVPGEKVRSWYVVEDCESMVTVDDDGVVTALTQTSTTTQYATVRAALDSGKVVSILIAVKKYQVTGIYIDEAKTKTDYVAGQTVKKSDIVVNANYSDGTTVAGIQDFTFSPTGPLTTDVGSIKVTYNGNVNYEDTVNIKVANVNLSDFVESIEVIAPTEKKEYAVGDILKPSDIEIKIKNIGGDYTYADAGLNKDISVTIAIGNSAKEWSKTSGYTFSKDDVTSTTKKCIVTVTYAGKTDTVELVVKEKSGSTVTTGYTATVVTSPTKKSYTVGEKFDITGAKFNIYNNSVLVSSTYLSNFNINYTFTAADVGKTSFKFTISFNHNGTYKAAEVTISGLSVAAENTIINDSIYQLLGVYLKQDKYPIDYTFSIKDIEYIYGWFLPEGTINVNLKERRTVSYEELLNYKAYRDGDIDIEVLDKDGKRKSTLKSHILQEGDVVDGEATLRFFFGDVTYDVDIEVGEPDISYIYSGSLIAEYEDIDEALDYTIEQDPKIPTSDFNLSVVPSTATITIKLGRDFKFPTNYEFNPSRNVDIDLNGNNLTLDSDQIEVLKSYKNYTVTVINSSEEEATLVYDDLGLTVVLGENEYVEFKYGSDTPGLVYVSLEKVNNGKVTADYTIEDNEIEIGYGSDIKFTITPNSGYVIDSLKVGTKVIDDDDYSVATNGTVTYILEDIKKDVTVYVTFKKGTAADDWTNPWNTKTTNPFKDVSTTSSYYTAVRFVYTNGLFQGTETNKFEPSTTMTRAMFVTVLGRLAEESGVKVTRYTNSSYTDVIVNKDTNWYTPYVEWATRNGIVEGHGDGTFGPDEEITHEQMYVIMYRYALFVANKNVGNLSNVSITSITDKTSISDWAVDAVKYAYKNGFIIYPSSTSKKIVPQGEAKRSELAMLLEQYCEIILDWENLVK